jgi:hypothetical protein
MTCVAAGAYDSCAADGWIFDNNRWDGVVDGSITVSSGPTILQFTSTFNVDGVCCNGPYAGIGTIDGAWSSSQYNTGGSNLPMQLRDLAVLKGAWTDQVPMPIQPTDKYRVYFEMFLSLDTKGTRNGGNVTVDFFNAGYSYITPDATADIGGYNGVQVMNYGGAPPYVAFVLPAGAYVPDSKGVLTMQSVDVKAFYDYLLAHYSSSFPSTLYLTEVNLAQEVMTLHGAFTTTFESFQVQKTGSPTVYTPSWTQTHWP